MRGVNAAFRVSLILAMFCLFLVRCADNSGLTLATTEDQTDSTVVDLIDGMTGVPVGATIRYTFTGDVDASTVTDSSFFIVPYFDIDDSESLSVLPSYNSDVCVADNAPDATIACEGAACTIKPDHNFTYGVLYHLCVTSDVVLQNSSAMVLQDISSVEAISLSFTVEGDTATYCSELFNGESCTWDANEAPESGDNVSYDDLVAALEDVPLANCICTYLMMGAYDASSGCMGYDEFMNYSDQCSLDDNGGGGGYSMNMPYVELIHVDLDGDSTYEGLVSDEWTLSLIGADDSICDRNLLRLRVISSSAIDCSEFEDDRCISFILGDDGSSAAGSVGESLGESAYYVYMTGANLLSILHNMEATSGETSSVYFVDYYTDDEANMPVYNVERPYELTITFTDLTICD